MEPGLPLISPPYCAAMLKTLDPDLESDCDLDLERELERDPELERERELDLEPDLDLPLVSVMGPIGGTKIIEGCNVRPVLIKESALRLPSLLPDESCSMGFRLDPLPLPLPVTESVSLADCIVLCKVEDSSPLLSLLDIAPSSMLRGTAHGLRGRLFDSSPVPSLTPHSRFEPSALEGTDFLLRLGLIVLRVLRDILRGLTELFLGTFFGALLGLTDLFKIVGISP